MARFQVMTVEAARRTRQPSPRNLQIYGEVRQVGERQVVVAARHGLSQRRVSQICQQVERWRARLEARADDRAAARRAHLLLVRQRYDRIFTLGLEEMGRAKEGLVTERTVEEGGQTRRDRTVRQEPLSAQWAKITASVAGKIAAVDEELKGLGLISSRSSNDPAL